MLKEYPNRMVQENGYELQERIDCHYLSASSDKVYIGTIQKYTNATSFPYMAICYYGRRGNSLTPNHIGNYATFHQAAAAADKMMATKTRKGYTVIGRERLEGAGGLRPQVVEFLRKQFPVGATVASGKGTPATVKGIDDEGAITCILTDGTEVMIPFGSYRFRVVEGAPQ